jgi:ring-1,2-phenylacetyl-CoA epoxidase subunit PaaD
MPISIVDLGIVEAVRVTPAEPAAHVTVEILPTFVGCPALDLIREEIRHKVGRLDGVGQVEIRVRFAPPWTVDRISPAGREALRRIGVTVPSSTQEGGSPNCPFCGSSAVRQESAFGPTRCRMIYYCEACRNPFEHMKRIEITPLLTLGHLDRTSQS